MTRTLTPSAIRAFRKKILSWYARNKRDLPWRNSHNPFHVLVSEFMLQQTQVERVIPFYQRFIIRFPDPGSLARCRQSTVLALWSGLGYNRRAIALRNCARLIEKDFGGMVPDSYDDLRKLSGVGDYTANAVLSFAFNRPACVVDVNVRRVFMHSFRLNSEISESDLKAFAAQFVPKANSARWHNALMDYGSHLGSGYRQRDPKKGRKQPAFEGSGRQLRGKLLKFLLQQKKADLKVLRKHFPDDRLSEIVEKLCREGILKQNKGIYSL